MAIKVTGLITPNSGSFIAEALHVVFAPEGGTPKSVLEVIEDILDDIAELPSGGSSGDASSIIYEGQQTIKQKIEALESGLGTAAENITYSYTNSNNETVSTNVKAVLDSLRESLSQVSGISDSLATALGYANMARVALSEVEAKQTDVNNKYASIVNLANLTSRTALDFSQRMDELESIARDLSTTFDYDAQFRLISRSEYNSLTEIERGATVFLIYDDTVNNNTYYTLTIYQPQDNNPNYNPNAGTFVGGHIYPSGTTVTIAAIPNSGFEFDHWGTDTTDTLNPKNITMTSNLTIKGFFKPATPNS